MEFITLTSLLTGAITLGGYLLTLPKGATKKDKLATGEIKDKKELKNMIGTDGLRLTKNIKLNQKFDFEGTCTIAPTGAGKTTSFFIPNLLDKNIKGSIVVTDPKGELFKLTSNFQEKECKRKVIVLNPLDPKKSEGYNPLEQCKDTSEVLQLSSLILYNGSLAIELMTGKKSGGAEWVDMATPLLSAALLWCKSKGIGTIENAFKLIINTKTKDLDLLMASADEDTQTQYNIFKTVGGADRTTGSIKITLATNLKLFTDKKICEVSKRTTFDPNILREKECIIYVIYPERKSAYLAPYMSVFFSQIFDNVLDNYNKKAKAIHFLFDEFANIGLINNMSINAATVRSRQISLNVCLQSISQLEQVYGKENSKAILNNLKTKIILGGLSDIETLRFFSELCGKQNIILENKSKNKNNETKSYSNSSKNVLSTDEIRRLKDNEVLLILHNKQPVLCEKNLYFTDKNYLNKIHETELPIKNITDRNIKTLEEVFKKELIIAKEKEAQREKEENQNDSNKFINQDISNSIEDYFNNGK